MRRKKRGGWQG